MSKQQGQLPAEQKDSSKVYRLTLTKEELGAVRLAIQIDYEAVSELLKDDPEWEHTLSIVDVVLTKIRQLEAESDLNASALGAKSE